MEEIIKFISLLLVVVIIIVGTLAGIHQLMNSVDSHTYKNTGQTVMVNGSNMRVYTVGNGEETIVILSKMGTPSPIFEYLSLAQSLSTKYKVAIVEYHGYGFSDDTRVARNNDSMVSDIRIALGKCGLEPPFILMPHSMSGIYAMFYSLKYPEEVSAIIGIDTYVPNLFMPENNFKIEFDDNISTARFTDFFGINRYSLMLGIKNVGDGLTSEQRKGMEAAYSYRSTSYALIDEQKRASENASKLFNTKYRDDLPVLEFLSTESMNSISSWSNLHSDIISNEEIQKIIHIEGSHDLHRYNYVYMTSAVNQFLEEIKLKSYS